VVYDDDRHVVLALELPEESEQRRDGACGVLILGMKADEGIEDEELRLERCHGAVEAIRVVGVVEPEVGRRDDLEVELIEGETASESDALEALAYDMLWVLGGEEEDAAGSRDGETTQTRLAGGDRHGHVESEERLVRFSFATDQSDGLVAPQSVDEPAIVC
jgi:hypothetical protein